MVHLEGEIRNFSKLCIFIPPYLMCNPSFKHEYLFSYS